MQNRIALVLAFPAVLAITPVSGASEIDARFATDIATYFQADDETLQGVLAEEVAAEDVSVCFFMAQKSGLEPAQIAKLRARGDAWSAIMDSRGVAPKDLYIVLGADFQSRTYSPLFAKFDEVPESEWSKIEFSDEDIINLVNLRVIYRRHASSIFDVMAARDHGKSFVTVNAQMAELRAKRERKEKEAAREAAREASEGKGEGG